MTERSSLVRPMQDADVPGVVDVHLAAFPGFFLSFLGPQFLRLFYREAVALKEIGLVATDGTTILGFVMGSAAPGRFFSLLLRRRALAFALAAAPALLKRPRAAIRLARALAKPAAATRPSGTASLLSLGVDPARQGSGLGKTLVRAFLAEARRRGIRSVDLTTDKVDNESTNRFYVGAGFRLARVITTPERRIMNEYVIDLGDDVDGRCEP